MSARDDIPEVSVLRAPPWSETAEQSVLASLLQDNAAFDRVADILAPADFYSRQHQLVFTAIGRLVMACKPADVVTVFEVLKAKGVADDAGGLAYLNALSQSVASTANARRYAEIVADRSTRRRLIAACDEVSALAFRDEGESAALVDKAAAMLAKLEQGRQRGGPKMLADIIPARLDRISAMHGGEVQPGIATGVPRLDRALSGGLRDGAVYVLAARPSVGKSSFAQAIGLHIAATTGPVLMLSQEMPDTEVADRALSNLGGVDFGALQTGKLADDEWGRLSAATERARDLPFYVDDQPALRLIDMRTKARQVKGLRLLVVDYLQLAVGDGENRVQEVGAISRGLKTLAKELGIPVILLSQLSRKVEERPGKEPILPDLRESGDIEQDADVVMFLWPVRELESGARLVGLKLEKNRQGIKPRFGMHFDGAVQRWAESAESIENVRSNGGSL